MQSTFLFDPNPSPNPHIQNQHKQEEATAAAAGFLLQPTQMTVEHDIFTPAIRDQRHQLTQLNEH